MSLEKNRVLYDNVYYPNIKPEGEVALLGFPDNSAFNGDTFDLSLGNWEINSDWSLGKKYDTKGKKVKTNKHVNIIKPEQNYGRKPFTPNTKYKEDGSYVVSARSP